MRYENTASNQTW